MLIRIDAHRQVYFNFCESVDVCVCVCDWQNKWMFIQHLEPIYVSTQNQTINISWLFVLREAFFKSKQLQLSHLCIGTELKMVGCRLFAFQCLEYKITCKNSCIHVCVYRYKMNLCGNNRNADWPWECESHQCERERDRTKRQWLLSHMHSVCVFFFTKRTNAGIEG